MDTLFYAFMIMIIIMIGLGFANRVWLETKDLKLSIAAFFMWGMVVGDGLCLWSKRDEESLKAECDLEE